MDNLSKLIDSYYKKILVLLAVDGGIWIYLIKFFEKGYYLVTIIFSLFFLFIGVIIFVNYVKMNKVIRKMEDINERIS